MFVLLIGQILQGERSEHEQTSGASWPLQLCRWHALQKGNCNLPVYILPLCTVAKAYVAVTQGSKKRKAVKLHSLLWDELL